jgi:hypothetical protein
LTDSIDGHASATADSVDVLAENAFNRCGDFGFDADELGSESWVAEARDLAFFAWGAEAQLNVHYHNAITEDIPVEDCDCPL